MKFQVPFFLLMVVSVTFIGALNIQNLLKDRRYVAEQTDCVLYRGRCDVVGRKLKALLPEVLYNDCRRYTSRQLEHACILIGFMQQNYPYEWQQIMQYYAAN